MIVGGNAGVLGTYSATALQGRSAVVTGAASGQGRAVALRFAQAGSAVTVADIDCQGLEETAALVDKMSGCRPVTVSGDLSSERAAQAVVDAAVGTFGHLDTLANCAGIGGYPGTVEQTPPDQWNRVLAVNLGCVQLLSAAAIPHLRANGGGAIVNWSSAAAFRTDVQITSHSYAASKGAIVALTTAMAVSLGPDRIRVNVIVPGLIDTPMVAPLVDGAARACAEGRGLPIGRVGTPDDIAGCALFLVSDAASFVTGAVLFADGGADKATQWSDWL